MSRRTLLGLALVATLPLAGCTTSEKDPVPGPSRAAGAMRLVAFESCAQLRDDLRAAAKESVGPWGFTGGMAMPSGAVPNGARAAVPQAAEGDKAAPAFSGTNTHEAGVDEPDMVKTDGNRIVTVDQGVLRVIDAASHRVTGKLDIGSYDGQLLLAGDRALVLARGATRLYRSSRKMLPEEPDGPRMLLVDLAGTPRVISTFEGEGTLVDARQTGGTARVVLSSAPRISFPEMPKVNNTGDRVEANRKVVDQAPLDAWLPGWSVTTGGVTERGRVGCGSVRRPPVYSGRSVLSVFTFDLTAPKLDDGRPVSIVADGDTVYGTPNSLYVANDQRWRLDMWRGRQTRQAQETEIYRFDVAGTQPPAYSAAGKVKGWLINQYAMSEWDGHLRVATTDESAGSSAVRVLRPDGDTLRQVGEVDGLGKGERIYSVRFIGPRGYVVTFRQTDPLYSVDLADPAKPRVTGQLKITGYSAHLQSVGDGRLIGIGQEADTQGRRQGTQVSLFDVSDPAEPRRLAQQVVSRGYSEAEFDPHAILWWPATNLLVVPLWGAPDDASALALRVTGDGLTTAGKIPAERSLDGYRPPIRRSLVIGNELWTLSERGLTASSLSTLDRIATVNF